MKIIITLLFSCLTVLSFGKEHKTYEKLCKVNHCWTEQQDIQQLNYPAYAAMPEHEWIRIHLQLVERTLRTRSTAHLSADQKANRLAALGHLNKYWHEGNFPVNDKYNSRTPIFIDRYDNFCAVGYLVKATGHEEVSRMIASRTNLAYVREMNYPELLSWAKEYGFTVDELAWIQPGYLPISSIERVGKGTDGVIHQFAVSADGEKLYAGGAFTDVDSSITANNIAYITFVNEKFGWHAMGTGTNGPVYAIQEFDNKVFVAGSFTDAGGTTVNNVAYWDGSNWTGAGCMAGTVKDFIVFKNELYAVGDFDVCASLADINFAKWSGTMWQQIPGLSGHVNAAYAIDNHLVLGGKFTYQNDAVNIIKWIPGTGFVKYNSGIDNEVNDIEVYENGIYAALTGDLDTTCLVRKLNTSTKEWDALKHFDLDGKTQLGVYALNSVGPRLVAGGDMNHYPVMGIVTANCMLVNDTSLYIGDAFGVDSTIYAMANFKKRLFVGGSFKKGFHNYPTGPLNSIGMQEVTTVIENVANIQQSFNIYPNPISNGAELIIENDFNANSFILMDMQGKVVATRALKAAKQQRVTLPDLPPAVYLAELSNKSGEKAVKRISITK